MPGGSFQTPADQESLSCLGEGLGRRNGSGGWSQSTVSHSAALVPEPQRPPSKSEVSLVEGGSRGCYLWSGLVFRSRHQL